MKITIVETGYVGLSNPILLAQNNEIIVYDELLLDDILMENYDL